MFFQKALPPDNVIEVWMMSLENEDVQAEFKDKLTVGTAAQRCAQSQVDTARRARKARDALAVVLPKRRNASRCAHTMGACSAGGGSGRAHTDSSIRMASTSQ